MTPRLFIALLVGCLTTPVLCDAQPIEAYSNQTNKRDTLINFGATTPFVSVSRTLWVYNGTASDIRLKPSLTDTKGAISDVINEFGGLFANEVVQAGQTRPFTVLYKADYGAYPVDSLAEARFVLDIEDAVSQRQLLRKAFILSGIKTNNLLGSSTRIVNFDSVFVSADCRNTNLYTVQSVVDIPVAVLSQTLRRTTPSLGNIEFAVDTFPTIEFTGRSAVTWTMHYAPADTGYDAAEFAITYRNPNRISDSSVRVSMRGVGVRHSFRPFQILIVDGSSVTPTISGDTIDIGELPQNRDSVVIGVVLRNEGNIAVGIDSVVLSSPSNAFRLGVGWASRVPTMGFDTLRVVYKPEVSSRLSSGQLSIWSDVERRGFSCVPFNARLTTLTILGRNKSRVTLDQDTLDFGTIEMPRSCQISRSRQLVIKNQGATTCVVDSASFDPQDDGVTLSTATPLSIQPEASYVVDCLITPRRYGIVQGTIRLWLRSAQRMIELPYRATIVKPDTLMINVAFETRSRPGNVIEVPVSWKVKGADRVQNIVLGIDVNPTILRFVGARTSGTACGRALVTATLTERGVQLACNDDAGLLSRDTLVILRFQTFLGDSAQSNIVILGNSTTVGTSQCPDTYPLVMRHGKFITDSLCGLSYKTHGQAQGLRAAVFPNPASDMMQVVVMDDEKGPATIELVDAYGRPVYSQSIRDIHGVETIHFEVSTLPSGHYTCIVQRGMFSVHIPVAVTR